MLIVFLSVFFVIGCKSDDKLADKKDLAITLADFSEQMKNLAGENAIDCGHATLTSSQQGIRTCIVDNYSLNTSFFASYSYQENDKNLATGLAYQAGAELNYIYFDSEPVNSALAISTVLCENERLTPDVYSSISELFSCKNIDLSTIEPGELIPLDDALQHQDKSFVELLDKVRGSVGKLRSGSKVVWSRKNKHALGLYISANHVHDINSWQDRNESFVDLYNMQNGIYVSSHLANSDGELDLSKEYIADHPLYHPKIPAEVTNTSILPADDFFIGIVDNQRTAKPDFDLAPPRPELVQLSIPLEMYDPKARTLSLKTWDRPVLGEVALVLGYPQDSVNYPLGAVSVGEIYTNEAAEAMILALQLNGDEEGSIPYDESVEFLMAAKSLPGMSGGGVFNNKGQLLGIAVRGTVLDEEPVIRVVKVSYIKETMNEFFLKLNEYDKSVMSTFVGEELDQ